MSVAADSHAKEPTIFTIFGATGDLAKSKLLPALFDLYIRGLLPKSFNIVGVSRGDLSHYDYREFVHNCIDGKGHEHPKEYVASFCENVYYSCGDLTNLEDYKSLSRFLKERDEEIGQCTSKLFYLAVPPNLYGTIFDNVSRAELMALCDNETSWARLLVEKPFGRDTATAERLEKKLCDSFEESQIYRIDHYLAKDAIENIFALRFSNSIIKDVWNGECIESICVYLCEEKDVSNRGSFYDGIGALRDVGANHMLQILALISMKRGDMNEVSDIRRKRADLIDVLELYGSLDMSVLRAQYDGYLDTKGVDASSTTETYFKLKIKINADDWKNVPVYFESGKALTSSRTGVTLQFRAEDICQCEADDKPHHHTNEIYILFSPKQTIQVRLWVKKPGFDFVLEPKDLTMVEKEGENLRTPEAYEKVLYDCIKGDQTRFVSSEEVRAAWKFISPILDTWDELPLYTYAPGSDGPNERDTIS